MKLGQLLSARSDVLPPRLQRELAVLRDHAPSISRAAVVAEFEGALGPSPIESFATFDFVPVACASIGQVHRATLVDGRRVAVKVRRPGVRPEIDIDVALLRSFLKFAMRVSRSVRRYDPVALLDEFAEMLRAETDYNVEAENMNAVRRAFENDDAVTHSYAQMMLHSVRIRTPATSSPGPTNGLASSTTRSATRSSACWARCSSATAPRSGRPSPRSVAAYGTSIGKDSVRISTYCFDRSPTRRCRT